jgi:hypothetical protein
MDLSLLEEGQVLHRQGAAGKIATFEASFRGYPDGFGFLVSAGLDPLVSSLEGAILTAEDVSFLRATGRFGESYLDALAAAALTAEIRAIPEGEIFFRDEPLLQVTGPWLEARLIEDRVRHILGLATMTATMAARCVLASAGRGLVDGFSCHQSQERALLLARAARIAGFSGTTSLAAGRRLGISTAPFPRPPEEMVGEGGGKTLCLGKAEFLHLDDLDDGRLAKEIAIHPSLVATVITGCASVEMSLHTARLRYDPVEIEGKPVRRNRADAPAPFRKHIHRIVDAQSRPRHDILSRHADIEGYGPKAVPLLEVVSVAGSDPVRAIESLETARLRCERALRLLRQDVARLTDPAHQDVRFDPSLAPG